MPLDKPVRRIAIIGTGVIGASWAAYYLARGFNVVATDPAPLAEESLHRYIDAAWKELLTLGLAPNASVKNLEFTVNMKRAVTDADFVQENGPERADFKIKLFADIDQATPVDSLIASSSSGLTMTVMQSACKHPERCVIGHPFNPPHVIPLVEVVGGQKTSPETIERAIAFYKSIGKKPIRLHKEMVGHVANRLQAALYREVVYLVEQGVLNVTDADTAVCWGPGLRWGVMGPNLLFHLGGGEGGIRHFMEHLSGPVATWWKDLGTLTEFTPEIKQTIIDGVLQEAAGRSIEQLAEERDEDLLGLLSLRAKSGAPTVASQTAAGERVFFLDMSGGRIVSTNPDGSDAKTILNRRKRLPDGIVIDVEARHIYWTNMGASPSANDGSIERADLDGRNITTIVPPGGTFTPKQLQLEKKSGKLYWSDREGMRVMRSNLDGSNIETLVETGHGDADRRVPRNWCVGIAVDPDRGKIYWTQKGADNAGEGRILRANIDVPKGQTPANRSDTEVLFDGLPEPIDLDLDLGARMFYWTDRGDPPRGNTVSRASMDAAPKNRTQEILLTHLMEGIGLALDLQGGRMFLTDFAGSVYSARLDGSDRKTLLVAQGNLTGVAYARLT